MAKTLLIAMGTLALALLAGPALADGVNPPPRCHCHVVHHHPAPPPPERIVYVPAPPPPCDGRWERDEHGEWACVMPPPEVEDISLPGNFFDTGGVGPDTVIFEGGGGGGGFAQASASASAFASASASVSIKFRGGFGHHMPPPHGGCGCGGHHGKW